MPVYLYQCEDCEAILEYETAMVDEKPESFVQPHPFSGDPSQKCHGVSFRKFTIPGMFVPYDDEDWVVRVPGEVHRERRDMNWRRKHGITES